MNNSGKHGALYFEDANGGIKVAVGATTVEITSLLPGRRYMVVHSAGGDAAVTQSGGAVVRWGADDASSANGGFDFAIPAGGIVLVRAPGTTANVIEMDNTSAATAALYFCLIGDE